MLRNWREHSRGLPRRLIGVWRLRGIDTGDGRMHQSSKQRFLGATAAVREGRYEDETVDLSAVRAIVY